MRSHDGRIDEERAQRFVVKSLELFPDSLPKSPSFPAAKAFVCRIPTAKLFRHIPPRVSSSGLIGDGFNEQALAEFGGTALWRSFNGAD